VSGSDAEGTTARLFVAVIPPESVVAALAALPKPDLHGVRWTRPDQWHVTLRFLGTAPQGATAAALAALESPPVRAEVGPSVRRLGGTVAMVPVAGLDQLAAAVRAATGSIGEKTDPRGFLGHITVARSRARIPDAGLGTDIAVGFDVSQVHLLKSCLSHDGARYEVVSARDLG
jgi:2'-5' RNA ligase